MDQERHTQETGDAQPTGGELDAAVTAAKDLIDVVGQSPVSTVRLETEDVVVEIHGEPRQVPGAEVPQTDGTEATTSEGRDDGRDSGLVEVKSPTVGVFYRRSAPDDLPFAEEGGRIGEGEQIGLIEAMKTYTPVKTAQAGVVEEFRAEDKQVVEYEEILATLRPDETAGE